MTVMDAKYDKKQIWLRWMLATSIGGFMGFAVPAVISTQIYSVASKYFGNFLIPLVFVVNAVAGTGGGAILGFSQSLVLRRIFKEFASKDFIIATAIAMALILVIVMNPGSINPERINQVLIILLRIVFGSIILLSVGIAQWTVLRRYLEKASWWIPANAIAWPVGAAMAVFVLSSVPNPRPGFVLIVVGIISGYLVGVAVGVITGYTLVRLLPPLDDLQ